MELKRDIDQNRVKPLDEECSHNHHPQTHHNHNKDKRLTKGCTHLMYACQQGIAEEIIKELRTKVYFMFCYFFFLLYCNIEKCIDFVRLLLFLFVGDRKIIH